MKANDILKPDTMFNYALRLLAKALDQSSCEFGTSGYCTKHMSDEEPCLMDLIKGFLEQVRSQGVDF